MGTFSATVASNRRLSEALFLLSLSLEERAEFGFRAGQFVILPLPPVPGEAKPRKGFYSLASAEQARQVDLLVEHREGGGEVSGWVSSRPPGERLRLEGPLGKFVLADPAFGPQAFLCSAAGLAPCRSMLLSTLYNGVRQAQHLFLGGEAVLDEEWRRLAARFPQFHYHPCDDPATAAAQALKERQGLRLYLAGFNREVEPLALSLQGAGFDPASMRMEKFG